MALGGILGALAGPLIGGLFPNATKPSGSGATEQMNQNQTQAQNYAMQLLTQLMPELTSGQNFAASLQPQEQQDVTQTLQSLSPSSTAANQANYNAGSDQNYAQAGTNSDLAMQAEGLGSGARAGNQAELAGNNAAGKSAYQSYLQSPEYMNHMLNAHMQAITQGMTSPGLGAFNDFMGQINGAHGLAAPPTNNLASSLGGAFGQMSAGGFGNTGGTGGGGGLQDPGQTTAPVGAPGGGDTTASGGGGGTGDQGSWG